MYIIFNIKYYNDSLIACLDSQYFIANVPISLGPTHYKILWKIIIIKN